MSEGEQVASGGGHDSLVKKELNLNQLAVYWNPTEDGNPCSMHLSDIPVEQAEVVLSRREECAVKGFQGLLMPCGNCALAWPNSLDYPIGHSECWQRRYCDCL